MLQGDCVLERMILPGELGQLCPGAEKEVGGRQEETLLSCAVRWVRLWVGIGMLDL